MTLSKILQSLEPKKRDSGLRDRWEPTCKGWKLAQEQNSRVLFAHNKKTKKYL